MPPWEPTWTCPPAPRCSISAKPEAPVRVGGKISPPAKLHHVDPIYPDIAAYARVDGVVILEATIDPEGNVQQLRVIRSIPMLDDAALDAVRQWKYEPTIVSGTPVPILMTVTVTFALA